MMIMVRQQWKEWKTERNDGKNEDNKEENKISV